MKKNYIITVVLLTGILLLVNILSNQFFLRFDLTENRQYTLSKATKDILGELEAPITITAYFSQDLPPEFARIRKDFQDMLIEYSNLSRGYINYEFVSPETDEEKQEALQNGIQPLLINVRAKDQIKQQQAFMGAVLRLGDRQESLPFVQPDQGMEYELSTNIKKLAVADKPSVGLVQGQGEPSLSELPQVYQALNVLYEVENIDLASEEAIPDRFRAVAILAPRDSFELAELAKLDNFLAGGGKLFIAINTVEGNLNTAQGTAVTTGLESWLAGKGLSIGSSFLIDEQCGSVTVQQQQGFFTVASQISFPYLPIITNFAEHPITQGLEQVILPFASPVTFSGDTTTSGIFTPLLWSSGRAGTVAAPTYFNVVDREWTLADFPERNLPVGGLLSLPSGGQIILIGDGDFPVSRGRGGAQSEDNISLMVNSIDWLADDTGLIDLRTKGIASRPIEQEYMGEAGEGRRTVLKYLNFGLPILLVLVIGFVHQARQRRLRIRRMQERYL